jgi:hypothetical protein
LLGQPGGVHHDESAQLGQHVRRQELQQVLRVAGGVDDQHALAVRRAAEEVDGFNNGLFDQHHPVGMGVLVDEAVQDRGVGEPGVPADQAVGPVRVVDVVADVLRVVAQLAGRGGDAGRDVARLFIHDDPAGPDGELVMHGALASRIVYRRQDTVIVTRRPGASRVRETPGRVKELRRGELPCTLR